MTLPSEEHYTLTKKVPEFLRYLLTLRSKDLRIKDLRMRASNCLHHYPYKFHIDKRYSDAVCEHDNDRVWCQKCKEVNNND